VLLSNAPRSVRDLKTQFARLGVPDNCYDEIITSGVAARQDLTDRSAAGELPIYHLGPERDRGVFEGLPVVCTDAGNAAVVLCTGLFDDDVETPGDYKSLLRDMRTRNLILLCANPDIVVQRGSKLVYCAGALAQAYEAIGGSVVYYGKPHRPIYDLTLKAIKATRPLAIGDGLATDIKGANGAGIDALFIADGIHAKEVEPLTPGHLRSLFENAQVRVIGTMRTLVW
jgi:HAD superfamily hydrolase (TIGR01459 family)